MFYTRSLIAGLFATSMLMGAAQQVTITGAPSTIDDTAIVVNVTYAGTTPTNSAGLGVQVVLNSAAGSYLSDGVAYLTNPTQSGTVSVYIIPPYDLYTSCSSGSSATLTAHMLPWSAYTTNSSTAWKQYMSSSSAVTVKCATRSTNYGTKGKLRFNGINLSGGEYSGVGYPEPNGSAAYFRFKGFNIFNLPTRWYKLQPDILTQKLDTTELANYDLAVNHITNDLQAFCVIQLHDYGRYGVAPYVNQSLGQSPVTVDAFTWIWTQLAAHYKDNSRVIFSLMNEPHDEDYNVYITAVNSAISSIRNQGATNLIMVQSVRWNSASNFFLADTDGPQNSLLLPQIVDPLDKWVLNVHQYFDVSRGGAYPGCLSNGIGVNELSALTLWLKSSGIKAYLGELGSSSSLTCHANIDDTLNYLESNADVWVGWAWWEAGYVTQGAFLSIEPLNATDVQPMLNWLLPHVEATQCTYNVGSQGNSLYQSCDLLLGLDAMPSSSENTAPGQGQTPSPSKAPSTTNSKSASHAVASLVVAVLVSVVGLLAAL